MKDKLPADVEHVNSILRAIRSVNRLIAREKDRDSLLQSICEILGNEKDYHSAWITLMAQDGSYIGAFEAGLGDAFIPLREMLQHGKRPYCFTRVLTEPQVVVIEDVEATCGDCPLVAPYGGRSALSVPLKHAGRVYGALTVSVSRETAASEEECSLFQDVADDIAFALHAIELEDEQRQTEKELKQAQERIVRQERLAALGQLAGGVAHELRNPLGVMKNSVYFLEMTLADADEKVRKHLGIIERQIDIADKIVSDLLDFARTRKPQRVPTDVNGLVREALEVSDIPDGIEVTTDLADNLPTLMVDGLQLHRVFVNLISNAVDAMPGGGDLTVRTAADERLLTIIVEDTGRGMRVKELAKIFEPLFTTKARGIGLGLPISRQLVKLNGGRIGVQSREGSGSRFIIEFPLSDGGKKDANND